ncbi:hypothetical protein PHJA_000196300 [Phtheirospermum japonicum]|uniref:Uncharacterized protein n=1 Tax=Phtheirospermum japonicum TaxID=374723 RepID=A0A830B5D5_9LAMI|nr:hypothetical protein PHJA_000196300 [Phtheirospermum japonicum]
MDIDPDIANWVLEFLLQQPLEDRILNSLLRALPLPNNNAHLKKILLLRKIESEVSFCSISESILELLEQLEELEFQQGCETVSDAMKRAYCAVAVDCTVKLLLNNGDDNRKFKFFEAVKRVWRGRIGRMEKMVEKGGLGSDELSRWKDEIEAAVWEDSVCDGVVKKSEKVNAIEALKAYMKEEREKMGPSFLELVAERVKSDEDMQGVLGMGSGDRVVAGNKESPSCCVGDVSNVGNDTQKKKIKLRDKLVGLRRSRGLANCRGAKIFNSDETTTTNGPSFGNYNVSSSAEINRVREALGSSASELHAAVKDPLPDALRFAEGISDVSRKENQRPVEDNHVEPNLFVVDGAGVVQVILLYCNFVDFCLQWDESIDGSQDDPASRGRLLLPSPRTCNVSPLARYKVKNLKRRRKGRKWSLVEEDTLRAGVQKYML